MQQAERVSRQEIDSLKADLQNERERYRQLLASVAQGSEAKAQEEAARISAKLQRASALERQLATTTKTASKRNQTGAVRKLKEKLESVSRELETARQEQRHAMDELAAEHEHGHELEEKIRDYRERLYEQGCELRTPRGSVARAEGELERVRDDAERPLLAARADYRAWRKYRRSG